MTGGEPSAVIVADGEVDAAALMRLVQPGGDGWQRPLVIAADGGATKAVALGVRPDLVVGDGDSLSENERRRLLDQGVEVVLAPADKDESDTELCLLTARDRGARRVSLLGAMGGVRPEHTAANLLLLADPRFDGIEVEILDHGARLVSIGAPDASGEASIEGDVGDFVSLLPLAGAVQGVRTEGLRFALHGETLEPGPARGLSNELTATPARVTTRYGRLLVVHTPRARAADRREESDDA